MSRQKNLFLVVIHIKQVKIPTSVEMLSNPGYTEVIQSALKNCKKQGDVKKQISKLARQFAQNVVVEQVFLTDNLNNERIVSAEFIIDIDNDKIVKNRTQIIDEQKIIEAYKSRYKEKIEEFNRKFRAK